MYLLDMAEAGTLTITGTPSDVSTTPIDLIAGWNWISYLPQNSGDVGGALSSVADLATFINSQSSGTATNYGEYGWYGTLAELDNREMYLLEMAAPATLTITGMPVDVASTVIPLSSGWNWLGYTPQVSLGINVALSNIGPGNASYIKSQAAFADYYYGYGWFGQLSTMEPFGGYQLFMENSDEFIYNLLNFPTNMTISNSRIDRL